MNATTNYWTATAAAVFPLKKHQPGFTLTPEQRSIKMDNHKYGLCCSCDAGLDDRADFICDTRIHSDFALMCNDCHDYYMQNDI